jgi:hypothetical protein
MPLNLGGDNDFVPYLKYNAKAGRFYVRVGSEDQEVVNPRLAVDMANIRTGWIYYPEGMGPEKVWDTNLADPAPRPPGPKKFKRGFEVMVFGADNLPGIGVLGLREWSSNAANANNAIAKMYEAYEAGVLANGNKVPFFVCTGVTAINGAFGTNYEPRFELKGWVEREKVSAFDDYLEKSAVKETPKTNGTGYQAPQAPPPAAKPFIDDSIPF